MWKKSLKVLIRLWSRKYEDDLGLTTPSDREKRKKYKQDFGVELFTDHSI